MSQPREFYRYAAPGQRSEKTAPLQQARFLLGLEMRSSSTGLQVIMVGHSRLYRAERQTFTHFNLCDRLGSIMTKHINTMVCEYKYTCNVGTCDKQFTHESKYEIHRISHSNEKEFICPRERCDKKFKHKANLDNHIQDHHVIGKKYKCNSLDCCMMFITKQQRDLHYKKCKDTKIEDRINCTLCGNWYSKQGLLTKHEYTCHPNT